MNGAVLQIGLRIRNLQATTEVILMCRYLVCDKAGR